jgi:anti-sigma factor RsiW
MDCCFHRTLINRYIDGELGYVDVAELQRHLDFCEGCAADLAELGAVRVALAGWGGEQLAPPPEFTARVVAAVSGESARVAVSPLQRALDDRLHEIDDLLGRVALPGGRSMPVRSLIAWGLAAAAVFVGIERRHVRRGRELRPS